ncbi:MAG TPA: alpha/beta fold hydrolase [Gemmatimonadaceae bacterium]
MRGEFLDLSGARVYYYAAGTRGAGNPVVFLHGFATSGHLWGDVVPLMPAGHRLVVVDLLGHGRSDRPLTHGVGIRAHAERVVELLDQLRIERACIVGHGVGGGIAQSVAIRHPTRVSHLGLVDSVAFDRWPTIEARLARATLPITRFFPPALLAAAVRREVRRGFGDPARAAHSLDLYLRPFVGADGRDALVAHVRALTSGDTRELGGHLAHIHVPTAIVWGQHDRVIPLWVGKRLQQSIPSATLDVIPGARHFTPEEAPRQVADAIARLLSR